MKQHSVAQQTSKSRGPLSGNGTPPLHEISTLPKECDEDLLSDLSDFFRELDVHDDEDEWTSVGRSHRRVSTVLAGHVDKNAKGKKRIHQCASTGVPIVSEKDANRDLFSRHSGGRKNVREERRRQLRAHLKKCNARTSRKIRVPSKDVSPHGHEDYSDEKQDIFWKHCIYDDDLPCPPPPVSQKIDVEIKSMKPHAKQALPVISETDDEDEPSFAVPSDTTSQRNEMAHIAASTTSFDKGDPELQRILASVSTLSSFQDEGKSYTEIDEWMGHLENLVILGYQIGKASSFMDVFVAVAAYAKMYTRNKSIVMDLYKIIDEVTTTTPEVEPQAWEEWSGRDIMEKWNLFKTNTIFKKVSYLITAAMSLTVCTTKKIEWSPLGLQFISLEAAKEQLKAVDVVDALVKTFVWTCEVGWKCFETKSFAPILYSDAKIHEYNVDCDYVLAKADSAIAGNIADLGEFEQKLNKVFKKTCIMKGAKNDGPTAMWLQRRYSEIVAIMDKLAAKRKNTDLRFQPIGFSLHGGTAVGKSTLGKLTMLQSLAAMGFVDDNGIVDESRIITMDMFDKYNSTWTSDILGVFMDDLNNTKSDFQKDNPHTAVIIKFFNNVAAQAIKAELNAKGVVFIDFKCGIITSNVKDLGARQYSNCPESILRRFYHVDVVVREEYRTPGSLTLNKKHPDIKLSKSLVQDIWDLSIEEIITYEAGKDKTHYKFQVMDVVLDDGRTVHCKNMRLVDYLDVVIQLSKDHKHEQDSLIHKSNTSAKTQFCSKCCKFPTYCQCSQPGGFAPPIDPHSFDFVADVATNAVKKAATNYIKSWTRPIDYLNWGLGFSPVRKMATSALASDIQEELHRTGTPLLVALTPEWLFRTRVFQRTVSTWQNTAALYDIRRPLQIASLAGLSVLGLGLWKRDKTIGATGVCSLWATSVGGYFSHQARLKSIQKEYITKRNALPEYAKAIRDNKVPQSILFVASLTLGVKLIVLWNEARIANAVKEPHAMTPESIDKQPGWFGYMMKQIGWKVESSVEGALPEHVVATGAKNQGWCHFTRSDGTETGCNIVYPEKGYVWFPLHIMHPRSDMTKDPVEFVRGEVFRSEDKKTSKFKFIAQLGHNAVRAEGLDLVCCFVERCPDLSDNILKFLPLTVPEGVSVCTMLTRDSNAKLHHEKFTVEHGVYGHRFMPMPGGCYTTKRAIAGTCMSMLVTGGRTPVIAGFHIGGAESINYGVMMTVTQSQAIEMREKLLTLPGIRGLSASTALPDTQYGKRVVESGQVHPNSKFIASLDENAAIDIVGSTRLRTEAKSRVVPSILKKDAEAIFGFPGLWGPPRLKPNWRAFNATLEHIIDPSEMFLPSLLQRARADWIEPIVDFAKDLNKKDPVRPLTMKEIIMGIPGKRFLDAMPMDTSVGYPLFGPKSRKFTPVFVGELLVDRVPDEDILEEYLRCVKCWEQGVRAYPVSTATLKDEATPLGSEKVRVFQAGALALGMGIRKYFLPIARVLSLNPLLSESAVGVNAFSPQWEELMSYAEKYAEDDRVIAWDYSKYDVRMNSQMTYAVIQSMIDIAEVCDYSEYDLRIMNAMVADIIHPLIDFNGTLIKAYNMNTSGNNITVNINGGANSIYVRMGFFFTCPEASSFREAVAATTYGDDFKGSVKKEYRDRFNFRTFKAFLATHGIKITEPNKTDLVEDDMHVDDADFLKRSSHFIPEIGMRIGALAKTSMYKPLFDNVKSKGATQEEVAISCVETYMHELFAHGREEYNKDQPKIKELCLRALQVIPPAVSYTFDDRVEMWKEKYL